ncbi:MAG: DUF4198 domain-containing protein [Sulfurimonas sp.]|nr:DUF4198 domain-containing protein [Sulfurimonas sp.]
MRQIVTLSLLTLSLFGHDIWITKSQESYRLHYGHLHIDKNHGGAKEIVYDPKKVTEVLCDAKALKPKQQYPLLFQGECRELFVFFENGYYTKTPYGLKNLPKNQVHMPLKSWQSFESVKYVKHSSKKPLSERLEIVLLKSASEIGDKIRLQIFYHKKPLSSVVVAYDGKPRGTSDSEGRVNLRVKHAGLQNIQATYRLKGDGVHADSIIHTSSLIFEVR